MQSELVVGGYSLHSSSLQGDHILLDRTLGSIGAFTKNLLLTAVSSILLCRLKHLLTWNWLISTQIILILLVMQSKSILFYCLK